MNLRDATKIINKTDTGITLNKSEQKLAELMLHAPFDQNNVSAKFWVFSFFSICRKFGPFVPKVKFLGQKGTR